MVVVEPKAATQFMQVQIAIAASGSVTGKAYGLHNNSANSARSKIHKTVNGRIRHAIENIASNRLECLFADSDMKAAMRNGTVTTMAANPMTYGIRRVKSLASVICTTSPVGNENQ